MKAQSSPLIGGAQAASHAVPVWRLPVSGSQVVSLT